MKKIIIKIARLTFLTIAVILVWFYLMPYAMLIFSPFSWSDADINKDGFVSPTEADYFANYGKRQYSENGKNCTEYYAQKDGLTLKKDCK